ncbi:MAG: preprotein translocase subunit SecG, partial [Hyphomonadaceae bacterium]
MTNVVLALHLLVAIALVALVRVQRSEGGALGIGGGSGSLISGRGAANALVRATGALAAIFFITSISLTLLASRGQAGVSVVDRPAGQGFSITRFFGDLFKPAQKPAAAPASAPAAPVSAPAAPVAPPPGADVAPAPLDSLQRAGPLDSTPSAAPASVAPARPAAAAVQRPNVLLEPAAR